jgi:DNA topoisomerase IB
VLAALVRLLDTTLMRVGNEEYASSNGSYGLTTLAQPPCGRAGPALRLRFKGKSGVMHEARLDDPRVAKVVRQCQQLPGQALFQYADDERRAARRVVHRRERLPRRGRARRALHRQGLPHLARHGAGAGAHAAGLRAGPHRRGPRWRRTPTR